MRSLKNIVRIVFFVSFFNLILSSSNGIQFVYNVEIKGISIVTGNVGKCTLNIDKDEDNTFSINIVTKTTNLAKLLYPYIDEINIKTDSLYSLLFFSQKLKPSNKTINVQVDTVNKEIIRNNKIQGFYSDSLYSPFSIIPLLRNQNLNINDQFSFDLLSSKRIKKIILNVFESKPISVPYGKFQCVSLKPISSDFKIKNNGEIEIWYSNDQEKLPLKIKLNSNIGTFIMKLTKVNNV